MNKIVGSKKLKAVAAFQSQHDSLSRRKRLQQTIVQIVKTSTIHGYPKFFEEKEIFFKVMWALFFFTSLGGCSYLVIKGISDYLNFDIVTLFDVIYEVPTLYPTVTVCNIDPFTKPASNFLLYRALMGIGVDPMQMQTRSLIDVLQGKYLMSTNAYSSALTNDERRMLGYSLDEMMLACTFNFQPCSGKDFEWTYNSLFGNCYKFNSGRNSSNHVIPQAYSTKAGRLYGLRLDLYIPDSKSMFNFETVKGAHIFVHNITTTPSVVDGYDISVGYQTNIAVYRIYNTKVPYPYSDCTANLKNVDSYDSYLYKETIKQYKDYRQRDCFDICGQAAAIKKCNCYILSLPSLTSNIPCVNLTQVACSYEVLSTFFDDNVQAKCPECPVECESQLFQLSTSFAEFPTQNYANLLLNLPSRVLDEFKANNYSTEVIYDKLRKNVLSVHIYYDELKYTSIKQAIKTTIVDLVSNVGGTLGLFLGMSFLSLVEFLEILIHILLARFRSKPKILPTTNNPTQRVQN